MFRPFDLVRVKATGALVTIEADYGPQASPRYSINESNEMYDEDELELVFAVEDEEKYDRLARPSHQKKGMYAWRE